jgi:predicted negative regulator of RcsB-dependent stress response
VATLVAALVVAGATWVSPWLGGLVVVVLLGVGGWLGWRALDARRG